MADVIEAQPRPIVTRAEALGSGLTRYFTGKPCKHGHIFTRQTSTGTCLECCSIKRRRLTKTAKTLARRRREFARHREKNRENLRLKERLRYANSPKRIRDRRSTPEGAINCRIRCAIYLSLRKAKGGRPWQSLVGYSLTELRVHLQKQFTKGMSWENRHLWHIDHITPLALFRFRSPDDAEFKAAWALTNLRPLWALQNMSKGSKRVLLL
jgi:hypothetical protein